MVDSKQHPVLIAEDNNDDVMLIRLALRRMGAPNPIVIVSDGSVVVDYLQRKAQYADKVRYPLPCALITDLKMPNMNGFELLKWLQAHPQYAVIPTIVLSSSIQESDIEDAYLFGANAYLQKPASLEYLSDLFRVAFEFWCKWCRTPKIADH